MKGFIIGTAITALAFYVLTTFLPQFVSYDGELVGLIVLAVIFGSSTALIGPVVKTLAIPISLMTMGLVGFLVNAALFLVTALIADSAGFNLTVGDFPPDLLTADTIVAAVIGSVVLSLVGTAVAACRSRLIRARSVERRGGSGRRSTSRTWRSWPTAAAEVRDRLSRTPGSASIRSRQTTCRRSSPRLRRTGLGPMSSRAASGRPRPRAGLPNERITLEGIGKTPADLRAAARAARDGQPLRWVAIESPEEAAALAAIVRRGGGPRLDVLYRLNPDVVPGDARGPGRWRWRVEVRDDGDGAGRSDRGGRRSGRPAASARHPPACRLAARRGRCVARRGSPGARGHGVVARLDRRRSTRSTSGAGSRSSTRRRPRPIPARFARELPPLLDAASRRIVDRPGSPSNRDATWWPAPAGWWPACCTSASAVDARSSSTPA